MARKRHFSSGLICRGSPKNLEVLVQGYVSIDRSFPLSFGKLQIKFPGGTNQDHPKVWDPRKTLTRELREELYLRVKRGINPKEVWVSKGANLDMFFFLLMENDLSGEIRDIEIEDGKSRLLVPEWMTFDKIRRVIYRTHRPAVTALSEHFGLMG